MSTPNLTDASQATVDLLRQYDCPHLQQAATDLQAAIVADLMQNGTPFRGWAGGRPPIPEHSRSEVVRLLRSGMTRQATAEKTGVSLATVNRIAAAKGIRGRGKASP